MPTPRAAAALLALALGCANTVMDAPALTSLARGEFEAGRTEEAIEMMREVVKLTPDDAQAHYLLGVMALRTDRIEEAEPALARAVELAPRDAKLLAAHGLALRAQKKWSAAESAFVRSLLFAPGESSTIAALGELYRLAGDPEKCAVRYGQFVWQLEQRDPAALTETERRALSSGRQRVRECEAAAAAQAGAGERPR
jgi:Flp pilus assembly protein TadD